MYLKVPKLVVYTLGAFARGLCCMYCDSDGQCKSETDKSKENDDRSQKNFNGGLWD